MIENFLRPPRGPAEVLADALRVVGAAGVVAAFIWWTATDAGILALALPVLVLPRFVGVRAAIDIPFCLTVLVAAWSNVLKLYQTVEGWDLLIHFVATGLIAAMTYLALARLAVVPEPAVGDARRRTPLVLVPVLGLAASAVWEMIEWAGKEFVTDSIFVTYTDTIGDMAAGGLGGLLAAVLVAHVRLLRD